MTKHKTASVLLAFMLVSGGIAPAAAFEVDGFRTGMTGDEVLETARALGATVHDRYMITTSNEGTRVDWFFLLR